MPLLRQQKKSSGQDPSLKNSEFDKRSQPPSTNESTIYTEKVTKKWSRWYFFNVISKRNDFLVLLVLDLIPG